MSPMKAKEQTIEERWTEEASRVLLNRKIVKVEYLPEDAMDSYGWTKKPVTFWLDDGTWVVAQCDDEGNNGGVLAYSHEDDDKYSMDSKCNKYDDRVMPVL